MNKLIYPLIFLVLYIMACGDEPEPRCGYIEYAPTAPPAKIDVTYMGELDYITTGGAFSEYSKQEITGLPKGLSFNGVNLTGRPEEVGTFTIEVTQRLPGACEREPIVQQIELVVEDRPAECETVNDCDILFNVLREFGEGETSCADDMACGQGKACAKIAPQPLCVDVSPSSCGSGTKSIFVESTSGQGYEVCGRDITYTCTPNKHCVIE